ncbi:hypothetical protein Y1Q_0008304 [Alligator mississippiensis]|uniref:Uncharacterized protein n=1 Tax=Alligator mississippiensis TaxID=8496 RepID=A0A151N1K0_ALLMI|nr:hypothetical protein Y1Q_0008304 [Alligator mississippiensis]
MSLMKGVLFFWRRLWKTTRRFTMATMQDLGMRKKLLEGRNPEKLHFLIEMIKSFNSEPFKLRFDYKDPGFVNLLKLIDEVMILLGSPYLHNCFSIVDGKHYAVARMILRHVEEVCMVLRKYIKTSRKDIDKNNLRSYIDALFFKQQEKKKSNSLFHDANVLASTLDLMMAGTETTSTTLQWAILLMKKYAEIQGTTHICFT